MPRPPLAEPPFAVRIVHHEQNIVFLRDLVQCGRGAMSPSMLKTPSVTIKARRKREACSLMASSNADASLCS